MAQKGANTIVVEAKDSLVEAVNNCIKQGIPASMVSIMVDGILADLNNNVKKILELEKNEYEQELKGETQQVEYVPEVEEQNEVV